MFFCEYCKIFKNSFFIEQLRWLLLAVLTQYSKVSWGVCSLILHLHVLSILIKNLPRTLYKLFFPCLNWLITCFRFHNMCWKNISCFRFWWKTYIKRCTNNYVISHVKRLSSVALCSWSSAFNFIYDSENGRMRCKQKY